MSLADVFGFRRPQLPQSEGPRTEYLLTQHPLRRVLAFTRRSIDDVVNDPIAKNEVLGYYKLHRQIERRSEVVDLEKQWNALG
jgi:hypothetical protein